MTQLAMSRQPTTQTHEIAHEYLHRQPIASVDKERLLFDEIMADPFEGDHWGQGYDSEVKEGWTDSDSESERGASSDSAATDEVVITPHRSIPLRHAGKADGPTGEDEERTRCAVEELRQLREDAYWQSGRGGETVMPAKVGEGWRAVSTGPTVASLVASLSQSSTQTNKVSHTDAVDTELKANRRSLASNSSENCSLRSLAVRV